MNKKGFVTINLLALIFVPGFLTLYLVSKLAKFLVKNKYFQKFKLGVAKTV